MTEKMKAAEFNKLYEFERKGRGLKAVPKSTSAKDKKQHKYRAETTERDGIKFPSKKEAKTYDKLKLMERAGQIKDLKVNAALKGDEKLKYIFQEEPFHYRYEPDFEYFDIFLQQHIVADAKGVRTPEYKKKKRLMKKMFEIEILEY